MHDYQSLILRRPHPHLYKRINLAKRVEHSMAKDGLVIERKYEAKQADAWKFVLLQVNHG